MGITGSSRRKRWIFYPVDIHQRENFGHQIREHCRVYTQIVTSLKTSREKMMCIILLLIKLTSCVCAGTFEVNVTQTSYQAEENHNITLEWTFRILTITPLNSLIIYCELVNLKISGLFHLRKGVEVPESQDEQFTGRVQCDKDVLTEGRLRLHVSRLRTDDSGVYVCQVVTSDDVIFSERHLKVTAARNRPKPKTPNTRNGQQPQSRGMIGLYCGVGLIAAAALLGLCVY